MSEILRGQIITGISTGGLITAKRGLRGFKGDKGDTGDTGATGNGISSAILNQDYTLTLNFTNGTSYTTPSIRGQQGATGSTGATGNGISNCVLNADYTLTITFTNGTSYTTPSIRGQQGETGATGATGQKGDTGNSGVYVGTTQPTDPDVNVWIDETGTGIELYTKSETDALLSGKANTSHNHTKSQITDFAHTHNDLYYGKSEVDTALSGKQATLVSGTNIKTINNTPILGSGDITVSAEDEIFVAVYDPEGTSTSYADVLAAYNAGKKIICKYIVNSTSYFVPDYVYSDGDFAFYITIFGNSEIIGFAFSLTSTDGWEAQFDNCTPYKKPNTGIPKTDLASAVQTSLNKADTALQSVPNTYRTSADQDVIDAGKVDKVEGKGLSTEDYTSAEKTKLSGIEANANYTDLTPYRTASAEDVINASKANQTSLDATDRSLDFLWSLNKGQTWDFDTDTADCYSASVPSGAKKDSVLMIGGKSVVVNQLVDADTTTVTPISGHKYFTDIGGTESIITSDGTALSVTGGTDMVIDLTQMFGAGNEPSTVAEFKAMFPADYYAYNTGEIKSASVNEVEAVGKNLFDTSNAYTELGISAENKIISAGANSVIYAVAVPSGATTVRFSHEYPSVAYGMGVYVSNKLPAIGNDVTYKFTTYGNWNPTGLSAIDVQGFKYVLLLKDINEIINNIQFEEGNTITPYSTYSKQTFNIPSSIQALTGYGQGFGNSYNYVDYAEKKYHQVGEWVNGVWTPFETEVVTDISSMLTDGFLEAIDVEAGGTVTHKNTLGDNYRLPVPNTQEFLVKLSEVSS